SNPWKPFDRERTCMRQDGLSLDERQRWRSPLPLPVTEVDPDAPADDDAALIAFQNTMRSFLETQQRTLSRALEWLDEGKPEQVNAEDSFPEPARQDLRECQTTGESIGASPRRGDPGPWSGEV